MPVGLDGQEALHVRPLLVSVRADHGGGPKHIELLLRYFPKSIDARVACPEEPPYRDRFGLLSQGNVCTIPHRRFDLGSALRLVSYVRREKINVIHTHGKGAGLYGRVASFLTGVLCVHTPHGVHVEQYGYITRFLYRLYEDFSSRWVNHVIFVSSEERDVAIAEGLWPRVPSSVIVNGVETRDGHALAELRYITRRRLSVEDDRMVVVSISRFDHQKNMWEAYEVVKSLPEFLFLWIGDGDDRDIIERRARFDKLDNLMFLGKKDDPTPYLVAADVFFSSSRWEGLPLAVLEAMACGLPVVASNVTGHCQIVGESGAGLLYSLGDATHAVSLLTSLSRDAALRQKLGEQGRHVQREAYSAQGMADAISALYERLVRERLR